MRRRLESDACLSWSGRLDPNIGVNMRPILYWVWRQRAIVEDISKRPAKLRGKESPQGQVHLTKMCVFELLAMLRSCEKLVTRSA